MLSTCFIACVEIESVEKVSEEIFSIFSLSLFTNSSLSLMKSLSSLLSSINCSGVSVSSTIISCRSERINISQFVLFFSFIIYKKIFYIKTF